MWVDAVPQLPPPPIPLNPSAAGEDRGWEEGQPVGDRALGNRVLPLLFQKVRDPGEDRSGV